MGEVINMKEYFLDEINENFRRRYEKNLLRLEPDFCDINVDRIYNLIFNKRDD